MELKKQNDLRCYIAFIKKPLTPREVHKEIVLTNGVDWISEGKNVLYLSTKFSGLTKSGFSKLARKKYIKR